MNEPDHFVEVVSGFDIDQYCFSIHDKKKEREKLEDDLRTACWHDNLDEVKFLLDAGVNFDGTDNIGQTALMIACLCGHNSIVKVLLAAGADMELPQISESRERAICALQAPGTLEYFERLSFIFCQGDNFFKYVNDVFQYRTAIDVAINEDKIDTAKILLEAGATLHNNKSAMIYACATGQIKDVINLCAFGTDIYEVEESDEQEKSPLAFASKYGHLEIVKYLLSAGANRINTGLAVPLTLACEKGYLTIVKALLAAGANIKGDDHLAWLYGMTCYTPLSAAVNNGHIKVVKHLLSVGADIKEVDNLGSLRGPVLAGNSALVQTLITFGVDIFVTCNAYWNNFKGLEDWFDWESSDPVNDLMMNDTMLAIAARNGDLRMVKILMAAGADANHYLHTQYEEEDEGDRGNVLEIACEKNNIRLIKALLTNGIKGNYNGGAGALIIAAENGNVAAVRALLEAGCNLNHLELEGLNEQEYFLNELEALKQELKELGTNGHRKIFKLLFKHD
jgi:ankyrin repeat protein